MFMHKNSALDIRSRHLKQNVRIAAGKKGCSASILHFSQTWSQHNIPQDVFTTDGCTVVTHLAWHSFRLNFSES